MKLAFLLFRYSPFGGLERNLLRIAEACHGRGHKVHVFAMDWQGKRPDGIRLTRIPTRGFTNHRLCASFVEGLQQGLERSEFDLVIGFNRMPDLDLYYAADICYVQDVARRRSALSRLLSRYRTYAAFERAVFAPESRTEILYLTESQKDDYMKAYGTPESRFHYLPPGIDTDRIRLSSGPHTRKAVRREFQVDRNDKLLLMVGSDYRRKGVERSIRALASLPEALSRTTSLFVIGRGRSGPLKKLSARLGVERRVRFLGGRKDVPRFLAAADLLLHPAVSENTGNAIVEALVAGVPVLATNNCGYAFHVKTAQAGKVVGGSPFDQDEMNVALMTLLTAKDGDQLRKNALRYADETDLYSRPAVAVRVMEELALRKANG
jgi:UDP-glucose:(heptosyl)LPS alpha-1,3-glucosyltransferase